MGRYKALNRKLAVIAVAVVSGLATVPVLPNLAHAQAVDGLNPMVATAVTDAISDAIAGVNAMMFATQADKDAAMEAAITMTTATLVATYGAAAAGEITAIVIATSMAAGVGTTIIGNSLGAVAAQLEATNPAASAAIAMTVANEGGADIAMSFSISVVSNGGSMQLADAGGAPPTVTGDTGTGTGLTTDETQTTLLPCNNPSCS